MGDPDRLLGKTSGSDEFERDLLGSLRDVSPRTGTKDETWNRLAVQISAAAALGAATVAAQAAGTSAAGTAASSSVGAVAHGAKWLTAKVLLGVTIAGSTAVGGAIWVADRVSSEAPPTPALVATAAVPPAVMPPTARATEREEAAPEVAEEPIAPKNPTIKGDRTARPEGEARRRDQLAVESRMLTEARSQLHAGDPRGALQTLDRLKGRSPRGMLMQERDVLAIQALSALGDTQAAKLKTKEFLETYPESPHAPQLRRSSDP